ncbi:MAG: LPXTG cell wall anchor domain-containing protein [Acidimicrobiales bacterium]
MKTKHVGKARKFLLGTGLAVSTFGVGAVAAAVMAPTAALASSTASSSTCAASSTCYVGGTPSGDSLASEPVAPATSASSDGPDGLPFTGADIEQLAAIGGGAILIGGLLVRRRRRTNVAATAATITGFVPADRTVWSQWRSGSPTTRG